LEHHVRGARLTDLDASIRMMRRSDRSEADDGRDATDYLRNLLFVPSATVLVAEQERRIVAAGVLTIRPSVRSGPFVGVIDELGTAREALTAADRLTIGSSLVEHLVRSARNKGCTRVEVTEPLVSAEPALWKRAGFANQGRLFGRGT
jgi:ribosomal protein S18 acetylase RimI-like enzyme